MMILLKSFPELKKSEHKQSRIKYSATPSLVMKSTWHLLAVTSKNYFTVEWNIHSEQTTFFSCRGLRTRKGSSEVFCLKVWRVLSSTSRCITLVLILPYACLPQNLHLQNEAKSPALFFKWPKCWESHWIERSVVLEQMINKLLAVV